MDIKIPEKIIRRRRLRRLSITLAVVAVAVAAIFALSTLNGKTIDLKSVNVAEATTGPVELSLHASGTVVPAFEEIITSPISTRIVEVYVQPGDTLAEGTPLLRLDLDSSESELSGLADQRSMKALEAKQAGLNDRTHLADLEMRVKVKEMEVSQLRAEVAAERRLDSIGSGTGERIRQAELAYKTAALELDQLRRQMDNERAARAASRDIRRLDLSVFDKTVAEKQRTLDDARVLSPRAATLTSIITEIGRQVQAGEQLATIADLTRFKVAGEIADSYTGRFAVGARALVRVDRETIEGTIVNIAPKSSSGLVDFILILDDPADPRLHAGTSTDVYIRQGLVGGDVVRLPYGSFYKGKGPTEVWVVSDDGETAEKRTVEMGDAGYDFVHVASGLRSGERVITSDMSKFNAYTKLKIKR